IVNIITRGESRKMKDHERKAIKRKNSLFKKSESDRQKKYQANHYQDEDYVQSHNIIQKKSRKQC
ncbi:20960_t:CDS:1, partial [Gigaspora rosea]